RFSCFVYRWFFSYWFLVCYYYFVSLFQGRHRTWLALAIFLALYPFSIKYYGGPLTDPMSHALFALSLIYVVENRWLFLAVVLMLGVLAKETVAIVVPAYFLMNTAKGKGQRAKEAWRTISLGAACIVAFLTARLPLGWRLDLNSLNGAQGL